MRHVRALACCVALLVALACVPGGASAVAQPTTPALTPESALRVLKAYERANTHNNDTLDVEGQLAIEAEPILAIDDATFRELRGRGETSLGEPRTKISHRRVYVPEQTGYPLQFLASERSTSDGTPTTQLLWFVRPDEGTKWKVALASLLDEPEPEVLLSRDGYTRLSDADHAGGLVLAPDAAAGALSALWSQEEVADATPFRRGPWTTGVTELLVGDLGARGIDALADLTYAPTAGTVPAVYRTADGGAICLVTITSTEQMVPIEGDDLLEQPETRERFTGLVVPGRYDKVTFERRIILALHIPTSGRVDVLGTYDGVVAATTEGGGPDIATT